MGQHYGQVDQAAMWAEAGPLVKSRGWWAVLTNTTAGRVAAELLLRQYCDDPDSGAQWRQWDSPAEDEYGRVMITLIARGRLPAEELADLVGVPVETLLAARSVTFACCGGHGADLVRWFHRNAYGQ